jgi:hypothetical protein
VLALLLAAALRYDVLLSAGHEGRPGSCAHFPQHRCNLGAPGEIAWTPVVVDQAARILRARGFRVAREPADFAGTFEVSVALFVHFDGSSPPCSSGASIGYHTPQSQTAARMWREQYSRYFPFRFQPDNFTDGLRDYYGFRQVNASAGALVVELGELTCPKQHVWLAQHLQWEGRFIANFVTSLIGWKRKWPASHDDSAG